MSHHRSIVKTLLFSLLPSLFVVFSLQVQAQDGKQLFNQKCASCHAVDKKLVGPALKGVEDRWPEKAQLYAWIRNSAAVVKSGYPRAVEVYNEYNKLQMTAFPELTDGDIDAILVYINNFGAAKAAAPGAAPAGEPEAEAQKSDSALLFGILTLILAVIALILLQVNSNLRKMSDQKEGIPTPEPVPFYRNKAYIATGAIVLFLIGGYYVFQGAQALGRSKDYQPEQPIYYSHTVHAGINQINCLYCHGGAQDSKHANIPYRGDQEIVPVCRLEPRHQNLQRQGQTHRVDPHPQPARPCILQPLPARESRQAAMPDLPRGNPENG